MSIKIIASDLDGTLMMPDHMTVSERTINTLKAAHNKGIKIAIATGRTKFLVDNVTNQIPFVDYIIYSNGAAALDLKKNEIIYSRYMNRTTILKLLKFFSDLEVFYEVYINGQSHMEKGRDKYFKNKGLPQEFLDELIGKIKIHSSIKDIVLENDVEKINLFSIPNKIYPKIKNFINTLDDVAISSSIADDIEINDIKANKGNALEAIAESINASPHEIMAFGDAQNDIEMLRFAEYSFAMENGSDNCKKNANFITGSNADDGLAFAVEEYALKYLI